MQGDLARLNGGPSSPIGLTESVTKWNRRAPPQSQRAPMDGLVGHAGVTVL